MDIKIVGIDLAKNVFQLCALNQANKVIFNRRCRRGKLIEEVSNLSPTLIALEACSSAHYWARRFQALGHEVRLLPPQHVKAFVQGNKNDRNDALAIAEAGQRPKLHPVPVKSHEQQDMQALHRIRQRYIQQRTATANQLRGIAREYGIAFSAGTAAMQKELLEVLEDAENDLTPVVRRWMLNLSSEIDTLDHHIGAVQDEIRRLANTEQACQQVQAIPGYGGIVASAFVSSVGRGTQFKNGRQCAAWLGIVPSQYSSGDTNRLYGITKNGNRYLRTMLIHGARAVARWSHKRNDAMGRWVYKLIQRRGWNKAVVALANKCARIAWAILAKGETFDMNKAFAN